MKGRKVIQGKRIATLMMDLAEISNLKRFGKVAAGLICLSFVACNKASFQSAAKDNLIRSVKMFSCQPGDNYANCAGSSGTASGTVTQVPGTPGSTSGTVNQPGSGGGTSEPKLPIPGSVPVSLVCSDKASSQTMNYQIGLANNLTFSINVNGKVCTVDKAIISQIIDAGEITAAGLEQICPNLVPNSGQVKVSFAIDGSLQISSKYDAAPGLVIIWAKNPDNSEVPADIAAKCDKKSSPLVIRIPQDPNDIKSLSLSPQNAVMFDLLGSSFGHKKVLIDWFTNLDYRFLTLPNGRGQVLGIDQLFGNNTKGPDGKLSEDGYDALAKFDGMSANGKTKVDIADGRIDKLDPVYSKLRVWLDANFDGVAQAQELVSLSSAGIEHIDLKYSNEAPEVDPYGNEIRMKSVVGLMNGGLELIFDLWFSFSY